jgi:hypothetical protein
MKKYFYFFLFCLLACTAKTQTLDWAISFGRGDPYGSCIDHSGNIYICGQFGGTADFDPGVGVYNMTAGYHYDAFVEKLDPAGNFIWARSAHVWFNGSNFLSVSVDDDGNVYASGLSQYDSIGYDLDEIIYAYDPSGNLRWHKTIGGNSWDIAQAVAAGKHKDVYVSGYADLGGTDDAFLMKVDSSGNEVWTKKFGGSGQSSRVKIGRDSCFYLVGDFSGTADFDPGPGVYNLTNTTSNAYILKLDSNAEFIWVKNLGDTSFANHIDIDGSGNIICSGGFSGTVDFDPGPSTFFITATLPYQQSTYILKLDSGGNFLWVDAFTGTTGNFYLNAITTDQNGNIYSAGTFLSDTIDLDPGVDSFLLTTPPFSVSGFVQTLDANGNLMSAFATLNAWCTGVTAVSSLEFFSVGWFSDTSDFDPGAGTFYLYPTNGSCFIQKINDFDVGISKIENEESELELFPNPSNAKLFVQLTTSPIISVELFDLSGRKIHCNFSYGKKETEADVSMLPAGIYFVQVFSSDKNIFRKSFMKE